MPDAASRFRVLLLGSDLNPVSVACASALSAMGWIELSIGLDASVSQGVARVVRRSIDRFGVAFTARRVRDALRARFRRAARSMGLARSTDYLSLAELAGHRHLVLQHVRLKDADTQAAIDGMQPDVVVVAAFGQILRAPLLSRFPGRVINVHPSLLPRYRGPNPYYWVLQNGERETGVTVHFMDEGIDTGDILLQETIPVHSNDTERSLQRRSATAAASLLARAIGLLRDGTAPRQAQDHAAATTFPQPPRGASTL